MLWVLSMHYLVYIYGTPFQVNDSEIEKNLSEEEHRVKSMAYQNAEKKVAGLQKSLKRSINKSR